MGDAGSELSERSQLLGLDQPVLRVAQIAERGGKLLGAGLHLAEQTVAGLSAAMRGLIAARTAVMTAVAAIDADMRHDEAVDDPSRIRRSRDIGAYLGLVPRRYQSGEVDYVGGISKCGDRRVRTLLYEAANVMLTRYKGQLKLRDWAFAIARRSSMRKARVALARRLAIIMHAMLRDETEFVAA
jgi:transposase